MVVDRSSSNGAEAAPGAGARSQADVEPDRLAAWLADLSNLGRYARYYVDLRLDSLKLTAREALIGALWGLMGLVVGGAALVTAVVLLLTGIARGVSVLANNDWAGPLTTGAVVLGGALLAVAVAGAQLRRRALARTREKYERLQPDGWTAPSQTKGDAHDRT
jgi:hypothetical protein